MLIFQSLDLERMLIWQNFFYEKVLFFNQLISHLMCKLLKKSWMLSSGYIITIHFFGQIQNSTPALIKFYKVKHFVPTESWPDSDLFQVIKNLKKNELKNAWHVVNNSPSVFLWSPNPCKFTNLSSMWSIYFWSEPTVWKSFDYHSRRGVLDWVRFWWNPI